MKDLAAQLAIQLDTDLAARMADMLEAAEADFSYPAHTPEWIPAGSARVCGICGVVDLPDPEAGRMLPTGVIYRGGPDLGGDEEFYRMEKWS